MAAQWPLVVAKLVALLPTLDGWDGVQVFDGKPVSGAKLSAYVTLGFVPDDNHAGGYTTTQNPDGFQRSETGDVIGRLVCQSGSDAIPATRARAFALMDSFDAYIRANRTLGGVLSQEGTCDLTVSVQPTSNKEGTGNALVFSVQYFTVT